MNSKKGKKKSSARETSSAKVKSTKLGFAVGEEVLACWQDGLYYLAVVKAVNEAKSKCCVSFQDGSLYWISFKHIRTNLDDDDDISCTKCGSKVSEDHNEIIICDRCNHGYHQDCHIPVVDDQCVAIPGEWFCRFCIFSKAAKSGGALKSGPEADDLLTMKQVLPYDMNSLKWDAYHKSNTSEIYCYCGGPGLWYYKMVECYNCRQWFHEACLQCLDLPLLLGDRFYYFTCALCNNGKEYLKRIQLRWPDIAHLVMYNLSLKYNRKYFNEKEIKSFVKSNWDALQTQKIDYYLINLTKMFMYFLPKFCHFCMFVGHVKYFFRNFINDDLHGTTVEERMKKITEVFANQKKKFRSNCTNAVVVWSLMVRTAPCPSKPSYLHEHCLKTKSEMNHGLLECYGNYSPETQGAYSEDSLLENTSNLRGVRGKPTNDPSTAMNHSHVPLFPSPSMFNYFLPSSVQKNLDRGRPLSQAYTSVYDSDREDPESCPRERDKRCRSDWANASDVNEPIERRFIEFVQRLGSDITSYEGSRGRLACGEDYVIRGRRLARDGRMEYLVEWSGTTPNDY